MDSTTPGPVQCLITPYWVPKSGSSEAEYEDACAPRRRADYVDVDATDWQCRCAVADGATEAAFTGIWAKILVRAYAAGELPAEDFHTGLQPLRQQWSRAVTRSMGDRPVPWYVQEKRSAGAFAALVGLALQPGWWNALAVGDSCLFQVRAGELLYSFPLRHSSEFGSRPLLLATNPAREDRRALRATVGEWRLGDTFLLMSDALAAWFLRGYEQGAPVWPLPEALSAGDEPERAAAFAEWIEELRRARVLRNDDVTLVQVETNGLAPAF